MAIIKEMSVIDSALEIAQVSHIGQKRKVSGIPYIIHPFRVYQQAKSIGLSKETQVIAILHDTYEDAKDKNYVKNEINRKFGSNILKTVILLSHDKLVDYNEYLLYLSKNKIALSVKLLDIIENLKDSPSTSQKTKYNGGFLYLLKNNINIEPKIQKLISFYIK